MVYIVTRPAGGDILDVTPLYTCEEYRSRHPEFGATPFTEADEDTDAFDRWLEHGDICSECRDWELRLGLEEEGVAVEDWPCVHMADVATFECEIHHNLFECPETVILYESVWDEYRLMMPEAETNSVLIRFCPWCGKALPKSRRGEWLGELEALGYEDPDVADVPERYQTDAWWTEKH